MKRSRWIEALVFTRKERIAVIVLMLLIISLAIAPHLLPPRKFRSPSSAEINSIRLELEKPDTVVKPSSKQTTKRAFVKPKVQTTIEINSADTSAFIALPGIGSKLANRILHSQDNFHLVTNKQISLFSYAGNPV